MQSSVFYLFDAESQKMFTKLSRSDVAEIRQRVPSAKRDVWFFWTTGLSRWLGLHECDDALTISMASDNVVPILHSSRTSDKQPPPPPWVAGERRVHARHDIEMGVVLVSQDGHVYRTKTSNVSFGGALIKGALPQPFHDAFVKIYLSHERFREKVQVRGRWVPNDKRADQVAFLYWSQPERAVFEKWLSVLAPSQTQRKAA